MGISTEVYTIYGWKVVALGALEDWVEEKFKGYWPDGVIADYDFENLYVGAIMFESGDSRWGEMYGESSFSEAEAEDQLTKWMLNNRDFYTKLQTLCPELRVKPRFISWVNYS